MYALHVRGLQGYGWYLKDRLARVFLEWWLGTLSLKLWLGIEGKHVVFFELWLGMASLELWFGMANENEHSLSCDLDWRVSSVWVFELWLVHMGPKWLPSLTLVADLVVLDITNYGSYEELHMALRSVVHSRFPACVLQVMAFRFGNKGDLKVFI